MTSSTPRPSCTVPPPTASSLRYEISVERPFGRNYGNFGQIGFRRNPRFAGQLPGKKKSKPPGRFFSSEARKKPKCLPAAGVEIFRIVLCTQKVYRAPVKKEIFPPSFFLPPFPLPFFFLPPSFSFFSSFLPRSRFRRSQQENFFGVPSQDAVVMRCSVSSFDKNFSSLCCTIAQWRNFYQIFQITKMA